MKTAQEVYDFLIGHINKYNFPKSAWYAGIAADPKTRLFDEHGVDKDKGVWAYDLAASSDDARAVEEALLNCGCKGGPGGGDGTTKSCYVYVITNSTRE